MDPEITSLELAVAVSDAYLRRYFEPQLARLWEVVLLSNPYSQ